MDATGPHRGSPPTQQDLEWIKLLTRMRCGPYDAIIEQEMSIEEAKRRFLNTPIGG